MAEGAMIKVEQIEGLREVIRTEVREALREETRPDLEDVEEVRRSPVGILIRLEEQVKALKSEMDQRFDALKSEMSQRFDGLERRFTLLQWTVVLNFSLLIAVAGKLFLVK